MLSIFEEDKHDQKINGKLTVDRLHQFLGSPHDTASKEPVGADASKPGSAPEVRSAESVFPHGNATSHGSESRAMPVLTPAPRTDAPISTEFQRFSEQFTRSFLEALSRAVSDIHALVVEDRGRVETACDFFSKASQELEALHAQVESLSRRFDSVASAEQDVCLRLGKAEYAVNSVSGVKESLQELRQSFEKRFDVQASAIRLLRTAVQERDERLEKVMTVFQALQDVRSTVTVSEKELENL
jgi:hypothetical protein